MNFETSYEYCNALDSSLLLPTTVKENNFFASLLMESLTYLGISDISDQGTWISHSDKKCLRYINWDSNEPHGGERYVMMRSTGRWVDIHPNYEAQFICAIESKWTTLEFDQTIVETKLFSVSRTIDNAITTCNISQGEIGFTKTAISNEMLFASLPNTTQSIWLPIKLNSNGKWKNMYTTWVVDNILWSETSPSTGQYAQLVRTGPAAERTDELSRVPFVCFKWPLWRRAEMSYGQVELRYDVGYTVEVDQAETICKDDYNAGLPSIYTPTDFVTLRKLISVNMAVAAVKFAEFGRDIFRDSNTNSELSFLPWTVDDYGNDDYVELNPSEGYHQIGQNTQVHPVCLNRGCQKYCDPSMGFSEQFQQNIDSQCVCRDPNMTVNDNGICECNIGYYEVEGSVNP